MMEPLKFYFDKIGINISEIKEMQCGELYCSVMLKNGDIGVCSTLKNEISVSLQDLSEPNLDDIGHRILLHAYYNAKLNYQNKYDKSIDIFDEIKFRNYKDLVMIGLFRPLLKKFNEKGIPINVFDKLEKDYGLISIKNLTKYVQQADAIILTATSIFNKSFLEIINESSETGNIFILGPSSTLDRDMFRYKNIKAVFGTVFEKFDKRVMDTIKQGHGSKHFLPLGKKVFLSNII